MSISECIDVSEEDRQESSQLGPIRLRSAPSADFSNEFLCCRIGSDRPWPDRVSANRVWSDRVTYGFLGDCWFLRVHCWVCGVYVCVRRTCVWMTTGRGLCVDWIGTICAFTLSVCTSAFDTWQAVPSRNTLRRTAQNSIFCMMSPWYLLCFRWPFLRSARGVIGQI